MKNQQSPGFSVIDNGLIQNRQMTLVARALSSLIQSLPEGTNVSIRALAAMCPEGEVRIAAGLRELEEHGYLDRVRVRLPNGRVVTRTISYNHPDARRAHLAGESAPGRDPEPEPEPLPVPEFGWEPVPVPELGWEWEREPMPESGREPVPVPVPESGWEWEREPVPELGWEWEREPMPESMWEPVPVPVPVPESGWEWEREPEPVPELGWEFGPQPGWEWESGPDAKRAPDPALEQDPDPDFDPALVPDLDPDPGPPPGGDAPVPVRARRAASTPTADRPRVREAAPVAPPTGPAAELLVGLRAAEPRLVLSARNVHRLAPLVDAWFARGCTPDAVRRTLTACLPQPLKHPAGLLAHRLTELLPPPLPARPAVPDPFQSCEDCGLAFRATERGLCLPCRSGTASVA